jgi:hypothetical protein
MKGNGPMAEKTTSAPDDWWARLYDGDEQTSVPASEPEPVAAGRRVQVTGYSGRLPNWRRGPAPLDDLNGQDTGIGSEVEEGNRRSEAVGGEVEEQEASAGEEESASEEGSGDGLFARWRNRVREAVEALENLQHQEQVGQGDNTQEQEAEQGGDEAAEKTAPAAPAVPPLFTAPAVPWGAIRRHVQRFILVNGTAAAAGAWGYGAFTGQWETGLPQLFLGWLHEAAATASNAHTSLLLGLFITGAAHLVGGGIYGRIARFTAHSRAVCLVLHWALVRIPVASALAALALYGTR